MRNTHLAMSDTTYFQIYDEAMASVAGGVEVQFNKRQAVLALARGGATELALKQYAELGIGTDPHEDALSLKARLLKDQGLRLGLHQGRVILEESAESYFAAYEKTGGTYSGINAATLFLLSRQDDRAQIQAGHVVEALTKTHVSAYERAEDRYYHCATLAEAELLLDRPSEAQRALTHALAEDPQNYLAHATTLRQLERILEFKKAPSEWLQEFRPPKVITYAGRIYGFDGPDCQRVKALRSEVSDILEESRVGAAYGALSAGSDLIIARTVLDAGGALNLVLPCEPETFFEQSVLPFGANWRATYEDCLARAASIHIATNDSSLMGHMAIRLAGDLAMGKAVVHADRLATEAIQVVVSPTRGGLTEEFRRTWLAAERGLTSVTIGAEISWAEPTNRRSSAYDDPRRLAAMLFADLKDFGTLSDTQVRVVSEAVFSKLSDALQPFKAQLLHTNSWGDGLFLIFETVEAAAQAAIAMQKEMQSLSMTEIGLPETLALRIGGHFGPIAFIEDPITQRETPLGSQIAYASRIEPVAVPGSILVSEAFAARLAISPPCGVAVSYVGQFALKSFPEDVRLYALADWQNVSAIVPR